MTTTRKGLLKRFRSPLGLLLSLAVALSAGTVSAGIDDPSPNYSYGATLPNNTGVVAEGFIYRLDQMIPEDIVNVHASNTPGYYPESEVGWNGDFLTPVNVWWFGSSTNAGDEATFSFVSSKPIVSGRAEWLEDHNGLLIPLAPGFEIIPAAFKVVDGRRGSRWLSTSVQNPTDKKLWIQRRINMSRVPVTLNDLVVHDRLRLSGKQLDSVPIPIWPGESAIHEDKLDKGIAGYILAYQLFEDKGGAPGVLVGTFSNSINLSLIKN